MTVRLAALFAIFSITAVAAETFVLPPSVKNLAPGEPVTINLHFPKLDGLGLAELHRKFSGRRTLVTAKASEAKFSFMLDASPANPATFQEIAELLRKVAVIDNFAFIPDSQNPNLEILTLNSKRPKASTPIFDENTPLFAEDTVISYLILFNHLQPTAAANLLSRGIEGRGASSDSPFHPVPNAPAVVITSKVSLIRKCLAMKPSIDTPGMARSWALIQRFRGFFRN